MNPKRIPSLLSLALILGTTCAAQANLVTFQVNMGAQVQRGSFHPATDTVLVAGDAINNWSTTDSVLTNNVSDTNLWTGTFDVPGDAGATVQYKFIFTNPDAGATWEGNVGAAGAQNRSFTLAATAQTLPVVYFNNVTNGTTVTVPVTFLVDLSVQIAQGNFDPGSGSVYVAGDALNNWSPSTSQLNVSPTNAHVWVGTFPITEAPGSTIAYKFVLNGSTWESRPNRTFALASSAQTLPLVFFNDVASLPTDIPLTFAVDMSVQSALGNFNPATDTVYVAGTFNAWSASAFQLTNSPAHPNLFSGTIVDSNDAAGANIEYKFVMNGSAWESRANRDYTLASATAQMIPTAFFNDTTGIGALVLSSPAQGQATLTWNAPIQVRVQSSTNLSLNAWQDVSVPTGQTNLTIRLDTAQKFYRLVTP